MTDPSRRSALPGAVVCLLVAALCGWRGALADAGPPYLTNDPGTPGNGNWEINLGVMPTIERGVSTYQLPQFDLNFGVGDRIQLTYEVPYVREMRAGEPTASGWGNGYPGLKWRFFDQGDEGWQLSTFPQLETEGSNAAERAGISIPGPRLLLPVEVAHRLGPLNLNFEAGYYPSWHGPEERILGFVAGHAITPRFELDGEVYNDHQMGTSPDVVTLDVGGRYKLQRSVILLFMAGRSVNGNGPGQVQFMGYFGIQILLSDYGRRLGGEP